MQSGQVRQMQSRLSACSTKSGQCDGLSQARVQDPHRGPKQVDKSFDYRGNRGRQLALTKVLKVMSIFSRLGLLAIAVALALPATTLQQLGLDEMAQKSTSIVRGHVSGTYVAARGSNTYTFYTVDVVE